MATDRVHQLESVIRTENSDGALRVPSGCGSLSDGHLTDISVEGRSLRSRRARNSRCAARVHCELSGSVRNRGPSRSTGADSSVAAGKLNFVKRNKLEQIQSAAGGFETVSLESAEHSQFTQTDLFEISYKIRQSTYEGSNRLVPVEHGYHERDRL